MVAVEANGSPPDRLAEALATRGLAVVDDFIPLELVIELAALSDRLVAQGSMRPARVGKGANKRLDREIRGDLISWFAPIPEHEAETELMARVEALRLALNRRLFLGLFDYEACHARYPEGARYRRHRDRFTKAGRRILTLVSYLNRDWTEGDGGELRVFLPDGTNTIIEPLAGRAVLFFSDRFPHEVLAARRPRLSVAGWFRGRP